MLVFNALSIGSGPVVAVLEFVKRDVIKVCQSTSLLMCRYYSYPKQSYIIMKYYVTIDPTQRLDHYLMMLQLDP